MAHSEEPSALVSVPLSETRSVSIGEVINLNRVMNRFWDATKAQRTRPRPLPLECNRATSAKSETEDDWSFHCRKANFATREKFACNQLTIQVGAMWDELRRKKTWNWLSSGTLLLSSFQLWQVSWAGSLCAWSFFLFWNFFLMENSFRGKCSWLGTGLNFPIDG